MPHCKGTHFVALREFLAKRQPGDWMRFLEAMPEADRVPLEQATSSAWIDVELRMRSFRTLVEVIGAGDRGVLNELGLFEAERDLSTTQRMFLSLANPGYALEKAGQYWRRFQDWGTFEVERTGPNSATATLRESVVTDELFCFHLIGYMLRLLDLVGAKSAKITHPRCRGRGHPDCVFEGSWRK